MPVKPPPGKRRATTKSKAKKPQVEPVTNPPPTVHRNPAITPSTTLEQCIARILLLRYRFDICRLFSFHLHNVCQRVLPGIILDCSLIASPGWVAYNITDPEIKQFFRAAIAMDLRQSGERVATKSVLWSYTSIRQFVRSILITPFVVIDDLSNLSGYVT
jgi:RNA polymerase II-associated protein 3